jgi:hypothetical protein
MGSANERSLIDALDALEKGESIDSILANYPGDKTELQTVLETAAKLAQIRVAHSLESQSSSKRKFLERAAELRGGAERPKAFASFFRRFALSVAPLMLVLAILAAGIAFASKSAVPGDALYGAKRAVEDLRFALTIDSQARQALGRAFEQERIREINALLREGISANVEFSGFIEVIETQSWIIAGIRVQLDSETKIDGEPNVGYWALVKGKTADGRLTAGGVIIKENGLILPEIIPTRSIIEPSEPVDPLATESPTSTEQPSPTPTETPSPTMTQTPRPTPEPSPIPSIATTPEDDGVEDVEPTDDDTEPEEEEPEDDDTDPEEEDPEDDDIVDDDPEKDVRRDDGVVDVEADGTIDDGPGKMTSRTTASRTTKTVSRTTKMPSRMTRAKAASTVARNHKP